MKFAVFISGTGSNLQAIIHSVQQGVIKADLAMVISNRADAKGLKYAKTAGIPTAVFSPKDYTNKQSVDRDMVILLKKEGIDFIVLAGYMRILTAFFIKAYPDKILNVHPSLLPAFKGADAIKDAFTFGVKITGVTIHFVDEKMDHGPIIMQESVKVVDQDTLEDLAKRIHKAEHRIYPKSIALFVENRLKIVGRQVEILPNHQ